MSPVEVVLCPSCHRPLYADTVAWYRRQRVCQSCRDDLLIGERVDETMRRAAREALPPERDA